MILDSRGGTFTNFAQNPSKTRFSAAADQPGFGCLGQQCQDLLNRVWGPQVSVEIRNVDSHIVRLRRKLQRLGEQGPTIETVWGVGYRIRITDDCSVPS